MHTWPEHGYAAVDLFTCGPATPLPCRPMEHVQFSAGAAPNRSWTCADGSAATVGASGGLWGAVTALVAAAEAESATVLWMERGMHGAREEAATGRGRDVYGLLGGLEGAEL